MSGVDDLIPLQQLRAQIDQIDQQLVSLLSQRMHIVDTVSQQKVQSGIVFRPRREQEKHASLHQLAQQHDLPGTMLFALWRVLMTQASYRQRDFVLCLGDASLTALAQEYFFAFTTSEPAYQLYDNNRAALAALTADADRCLAMIKPQSQAEVDDWPEMLLQSPARIMTSLPWPQGISTSATTPQAYVIADAPWDLAANAAWVVWFPMAVPMPDEQPELYISLHGMNGGTNGTVAHYFDPFAYADQQAMFTAFITRFHAHTAHDAPAAQLLGRIPSLPPSDNVMHTGEHDAS